MKSIQKNNKGFTLLEIIIVIIIIGVLASLALPRFLRTVEYSRGSEALSHLSAIRQSMQRCYLISNSFAPCATFADLDVEDPGPAVGSHFSPYTITGLAPTTFLITATRNALDNGNVGDQVTINESGVKSGSGAFTSIR